MKAPLQLFSFHRLIICSCKILVFNICPFSKEKTLTNFFGNAHVTCPYFQKYAKYIANLDILDNMAHTDLDKVSNTV